MGEGLPSVRCCFHQPTTPTPLSLTPHPMTHSFDSPPPHRFYFRTNTYGSHPLALIRKECVGRCGDASGTEGESGVTTTQWFGVVMLTSYGMEIGLDHSNTLSFKVLRYRRSHCLVTALSSDDLMSSVAVSMQTCMCSEAPRPLTC